MNATTQKRGRGRPAGSRNRIKPENLPIFVWKCKNPKCKAPVRMETTVPAYAVYCGCCHKAMDCNKTKGIVK